jgi:plastocyanin
MRRLLFGGLTLFAAIALAACGGAASPAASSAPPAASQPAASEPAASEPAASEPAPSEPAGAACAPSTDAATVDTSIADFAFEQPLTATVGDVVGWTNDDTAPHSVVLDDGSCETAPIDPGAAASLKFDAAGSYPFHCGIHSQMKGTIEVTE